MRSTTRPGCGCAITRSRSTSSSIVCPRRDGARDLGALPLKLAGTERGSPDQAYPRFKLNGTIDWSALGYGASFTGRYISKVAERDGVHTMGSTFCGDVQLYFSPAWMDHRWRLTLGVNNVFDRDPPRLLHLRQRELRSDDL